MHTDQARTVPGYVLANPDDGVTVTDAEGHTLTVIAVGGDRIDVRSTSTLRLDPGTIRAFATALLGFADYTATHPSGPQFPAPEDDGADEDVCAVEDCDRRLDDGEGYGGYCGDHADLIESHREATTSTYDASHNPDCPTCSREGCR